MLNLTSRLAIKIKYLPDYEFDWSDTSPQRPQTSLRVEDFLPNENDATARVEAEGCSVYDGVSSRDLC